MVARPLSVAIILLFCSLLATPSRAEPPLKTLADPHYGEALYNFYQQDYFAAIVTLLVAKDQRRLPNHQEDAELLLGGLYLAYGLHQQAQKIFTALLHNQPLDIRNRAWYQLAELTFQRGYPEQAREALSRMVVTSREPYDEWEAKRRLLLAQLDIAAQREDRAVVVLEGEFPEELAGYALYNRAIAWLRLGDQRAFKALDRLGQASGENLEDFSLRDRANLSLALARLRANQPAEAEPSLERISLSGSLANQALLGLGRARLAQHRPEEALSPLFTLSQRPLDDPAVQEGLLALPQALDQAGQFQQAASYYQQANKRLEAFKSELQQSRRQLTSPFWLKDLALAGDAPGRYGLHTLLAQHPFQEPYQDYRELLAMRQNLIEWAASLGAFEEMLSLRRQRYQSRLPQVNAAEAKLGGKRLHAELAELRAQLEVAERRGDVWSFAPPLEQQQWQRLQQLTARIDKLPRFSDEVEKLRQQQELLQGVLIWEQGSELPARRWQVEKQLKQAERGLEQSRELSEALRRAKQQAPEQFAGFERRIESLRSRLQSLQKQLAQLLPLLEHHLSQQVLALLDAQASRIATLQQQAKLARAQSLDRANGIQPAAEEVAR